MTTAHPGQRRPCEVRQICYRRCALARRAMRLPDTWSRAKAVARLLPSLILASVCPISPIYSGRTDGRKIPSGTTGGAAYSGTAGVIGAGAPAGHGARVFVRS